MKCCCILHASVIRSNSQHRTTKNLCLSTCKMAYERNYGQQFVLHLFNSRADYGIGEFFPIVRSSTRNDAHGLKRPRGSVNIMLGHRRFLARHKMGRYTHQAISCDVTVTIGGLFEIASTVLNYVGQDSSWHNQRQQRHVTERSR